VAEELGSTPAIDYKSEDVQAALSRACPKGIDIYFDNVGGDILDIALSLAGAPRARHHLWSDFAVQQHRQ